MSPVMIRSVQNSPPGVPVHQRRPRATSQCAASDTAMKEFDPFRLDTVNQCLWQRGDHGDEERILLKPKAFGILRYLVDHAGRLVTQDELLDAVWPDTHVQPLVLKRHIVDIRNALGDDPRCPTYIETRPWLGYQFITAVRSAPSAEPAADFPARAGLAGKDRALGDLQAHLREAIEGQRQIVFVKGDSGIGKTTLVEEFQRRTAASMPIRIARGRCVEGAWGEPYWPMREALGCLCRAPEGASVAQILAARAPTWLAQFPALAKCAEYEMPRRNIPEVVRREMLREIVDLLETIASESPLLLVLEDLHGVDPSTAGIVSALAHGWRAAKLMVIGTHRPVDIGLAGHPLESIESDPLVHRYVMNSFWSRCGQWE